MLRTSHKSRWDVQSQSGFTIVEVLVAALIMTILAAGIMTVITSTSKNQNRSKVVSRQRAIVDGLIKKVNSDPQFLRIKDKCVASEGCTIQAVGAFPSCIENAGHVYPCKDQFTFENKHPFVADLVREEEETIITHAIVLQSTGFDDEADGLGVSAPDPADRDKDGILPDRFEVKVINRTDAKGLLLSAEDRSTTGTYSSKSTINNAKRTGTGALIVSSCSVSQIDERMPVGLCSNSSQTVDMRPPSECPNTTSKICQAWTAAKASSATPNPTQMVIEPVTDKTYTLEGPINRAGSMKREGLGLGDTITDLPPGEYTVDVDDPPRMGDQDMKVWASHSVPGDGRLSIEAGNLKNAVIVFKPQVSQSLANPPVLGAYSYDQSYPTQHNLLRTSWNDSTLAWRIRNASLSYVSVKLMPVPTTRTTLTRSTTNAGWTIFERCYYGNGYPNAFDINGTIPPIDSCSRGSSLPQELEPGLYAAHVIHNQAKFPYGVHALLGPNFDHNATFGKPSSSQFLQYLYVSPGAKGKIAGVYNEYCLGDPADNATARATPREQWIDSLCGTYRPWCWLRQAGQENFVGSCGASSGSGSGPGTIGSGGV